MAERSVIAKLGSANYLPKRIHGLKEDQKELVLGTVVGKANKIFEGEMPNGDRYKGVSGLFEFTDADPERGVLSSGKLFLPSGIDEMIYGAIEAAEGGEVLFAFEVSVFRADNPQGYSWKYTPIMDAQESDPLAELRKLADARRVAKKPQEALPSPEAVAAGEKAQEVKAAEASAAKK